MAYKAEGRQKAFSLAVSLAEHGAQVCVTCRRTEYKVWVSLRTLPSTTLAPLEEALSAV
ncbi:hypothetical protein H6F90_25705 [Trichocoleus sp. FACHB-591]|uniref:hypothetical protein n=1 Tax=unclassified Trichocoleus TaxID=2628910 RepID=UPI001683DB96|nr:MULTISPECIES: hypothetical protein [unclassified Trichocoleus]MBD2098471.1 hypothetical protein [Trichocoleus sp. FACHB-591]MBD2123404.1 hypothetical protein [Trichocoleus sp. FACHB-262]